jgi:hypothetical protein
MTTVFLNNTTNYISVTLLYHNQPQLISNGPFSGDYTAGLVAGLFTLFRQEAGPNPYYLIEVLSENGNIFRFDLRNASTFISQISNFMVIEGEIPVNIPRSSSLVRFNQYGWWIRASYTQEERFNLYTFQTEDFISGFIAAFAQTDYDFRNYIAGPPFLYDSVTKQIQPVLVLGYEIKLYNPLPRTPDLLVPYETMVYESGVRYGVDYD